jgi:hypothetical protein
MIRHCLPAACIVLVVSTSSAGAQVFVEPATREPIGAWMFDVAGQLARPVGAFGTQIDRAWGVGGSVRHHFRSFTPLGVRADVAWLNYGNEKKRVPLSPTLNRVVIDMRTTNNIALVTGGPELMLTKGPIRPYIYAFAGFSYFYTESSANEDNGGNTFARSTNFDDSGLTTGWGTGLRLPITIRSVEAAVDAGARLTRNGTRTYLRRGDIVDRPDGTLQLNSRTTPADFGSTTSACPCRRAGAERPSRPVPTYGRIAERAASSCARTAAGPVPPSTSRCSSDCVAPSAAKTS